LEGSQTKYLEPLLQRFPNGRFAEQAELLKDELDKKIANKEMHNAKRAKDGLLNRSREQMLEAERFREFGDRFHRARKVYWNQAYYQDDPNTHLHAAPKDRIDELKAEEGERICGLSERRLKDADALMKKGKQGAAKDIWQSVKTLYKDHKEVRSGELRQSRVTKARSRARSMTEETESPNRSEVNLSRSVAQRIPWNGCFFITIESILVMPRAHVSFSYCSWSTPCPSAVAEPVTST